MLATAVGYEGGHDARTRRTRTSAPEDTGHAEAVEVDYDPARVSYDQLLNVFWENHDPTTLNRQGPDVGEQYRSAIFFHDAGAGAGGARVEGEAREERAVSAAGRDARSRPRRQFWKAEDYHQQYLEKRGLATCKI